MNTFAVLAICIQACLVQSVFGQCLGRAAGCAPAAAVATPGFVTPSNYAPGAIGAYGYGAGLGGCGYGAGLGGIGYGAGLGGIGYGAGLGGIGYGAGLGGLGYGGALGGYAGYGLESYGGAGEGNVAVAGELPVAGATALAGQVPILGAVRFGGDVCAGGAVSIAGNCACGCGCGSRYL